MWQDIYPRKWSKTCPIKLNKAHSRPSRSKQAISIVIKYTHINGFGYDGFVELTGKYERSKLLICLHLRAINSTPKSPTRKHHFKQRDLNFLHPTAIQPIPISVIDLHLAKLNLSKFLASAIADAAKSVNCVALHKSTSTRPEQLTNKLDNPAFVKNLDLDRLIDCRVALQVEDMTLSVLSSTRGHMERSRWETKGYRWKILGRSSGRRGLRVLLWRDSMK